MIVSPSHASYPELPAYQPSLKREPVLGSKIELRIGEEFGEKAYAIKIIHGSRLFYAMLEGLNPKQAIEEGVGSFKVITSAIPAPDYEILGKQPEVTGDRAIVKGIERIPMCIRGKTIQFISSPDRLIRPRLIITRAMVENVYSQNRKGGPLNRVNQSETILGMGALRIFRPEKKEYNIRR